MFTPRTSTLHSLAMQNKDRQKIVIISDAGRYHDDEIALVVAAGMVKSGLIEIKGVIANLKPAKLRARLIKGILTALNLPDIPVGMGEAVNEHADSSADDFHASYLSAEEDFPNGQLLLKKILEHAEESSLTLLLISGLTDANLFLADNVELAKRKLKKIVFMGGVETDQQGLKLDAHGYLMPDKSYNNNIDLPSAQSSFQLIQAADIPFTIISRHCGMACAFTPSFYERLAQENSPIGKRLYGAQAKELQNLWQRVCLELDDVRREDLAAYCNKQWFLKTYTNNSPALHALTTEDNIWPHISKLTIYDAVTLLFAVLPELFSPVIDTSRKTEYAVAGISADHPGVDDIDQVRRVLTAFAVHGLSVGELYKSLIKALSIFSHAVGNPIQDTNIKRDFLP